MRMKGERKKRRRKEGRKEGRKERVVVHTCNPSIRKWWQDDQVFMPDLGYIVRYCLKKQNKN
jgi:hypothetical protein